MANGFRIVNIGDSVPWGQGLLEAQKFDVLVREALRVTHPNITLERLAHSGAVIGNHPAAGGPAAGEVPVSLPTVIEQCDTFQNAPETVDLVLVNGGINDVGLTNILNPFSLIPTLGSRIKSACRDRMLVLLQKVSAKFSKPSCRILVTGYYTILSKQSNPLNVPRMLALYGISTPPFLNLNPQDMPNLVVDRCEQFFRESEQHLRTAVTRAADPRIRFVPSGFTDANAIFVQGTALLWGLTHLLGPQDPVAATRAPQCDVAFPKPFEFLHREQCHRASAGHPNVAGAVQYRNQILAALSS